jgi:nitroimidazol reductase NimA-like FMN-containing flavoprotein (pyridoxamine 5'-phosphate oxidase superfamily)
MSEEIKRRIGSYLAVHEVIRLATVASDGKPTVASLPYVNEGATIYFPTGRTTQKAVNIAGNPKVAYTCDEDYEDWWRIQGIQMQGTASVVSEEELPRIMDMMIKKFPQLGNIPRDLDMAIYKVEPNEGFFLDSTKGFLHRDKVDF